MQNNEKAVKNLQQIKDTYLQDFEIYLDEYFEALEENPVKAMLDTYHLQVIHSIHEQLQKDLVTYFLTTGKSDDRYADEW